MGLINSSVPSLAYASDTMTYQMLHKCITKKILSTLPIVISLRGGAYIHFIMKLYLKTNINLILR